MCITYSGKCISFCFFNTKRYTAYLNTNTIRKAGEAGFWLQCLPLKVDKTSRSKNVKNASSQHFANTEWCLQETFSLKLQIKKYFSFFFFFPLFLSLACTFWLKANKISKQMHCVYYFFLFLLFLSISIQYLNFVLIIHGLSVLIILPHLDLKLSYRYISHLCFSVNAEKRTVNSKCGILPCWILLLI